MTRNGEGPAVQSEAFEITTTPAKEQTMSTQSIPTNTATTSDLIASDTYVDFRALEEWKQRSRVERRAFRLAHPAIDAALSQVPWAETVVVDAVEGEEADLVFSRNCGVVELTSTAEFVGGEVFLHNGGTPDVYLDWARYSERGMSVSDMRNVAAGLLAAIPVVEAARVTA